MKELLKKRKEKGITLLALVITVIVLVILSAVSINLLLGDQGIITRAKEAKEMTEIADIKTNIQLEIIDKQLEDENGNISEETLEGILEKYGTINYEEDGITIKSITTTTGNYEIAMSDIWSGTTNDNFTVVADGSWNGTVNTPKIDGTGLTAVYWNGKKWTKLTSTSSKKEWNKWYDYSQQNWANAQSDDGSMWVWIPRYEYKVDSTNKKIDVRFIPIDVKKGTSGYTTDSTGIITSSSDKYIIHPAFINDSSNGYTNGGWDKELSGFWVAKYGAGYQNATEGEDTKTVQYSNLKYTTVNSSYTSNFLTDSLTTNTNISYPVFKANTYAYNLISAGDVWLLSQEIDTASMYGLSNVDSHLTKNSEWGAVAYLTHSQYGVNGNSTNMNEVTANNKALDNSIYVNNAESGASANVRTITSYGSNNTPNDINASSTKNMTGVFDLSGFLYERVAVFFKGGTVSNEAWHSAMAKRSATASTKYLTLYTANNKKGDTMNETSGWNSDWTTFVRNDIPIAVRGGSRGMGDRNGIFAYGTTNGEPLDSQGFRVCLAY